MHPSLAMLSSVQSIRRRFPAAGPAESARAQDRMARH